MAKLCSKCGKEIADDAAFCNFCGEKVSDNPSASGSTGANSQGAPFSGQPGRATEAYSTEDIQANKVWAGLAYILSSCP